MVDRSVLADDNSGLRTGSQVRPGNLHDPHPAPVPLGTYTRDAANGLLTQRVLGDVKETWTYNGFADVEKYKVWIPQSVHYQEEYTKRDGLGRVTERKVTHAYLAPDTWTYTYHATRGWLTSASKNGAQVGAWTYDARGNRLSETANGVTTAATFDAQDKQLTAGSRTLTYGDDLGRVTAEAGPGGDARAYVWDAGGRLVQAQIVVNGTATQVDYTLDAAGRRVGKKVNGTLVAGWLYDGALRPTAQLDTSGKLALRFAYGSLGHSPDAAVRFDTATGAVAGVYWFVHDQVGSVVAVVDTATGAVVERSSYGPWGNRTVEVPNAVFSHPFGFAGGLHDADTGLVRFGAREYDPRIGRWLARDPIGLRGGGIRLRMRSTRRRAGSTPKAGRPLLPVGASCLHRQLPRAPPWTPLGNWAKWHLGLGDGVISIGRG
ncbi:MAG: hypothetical protein FJ100_13820 [Deltaproteobacteria bacterium]|nr:hypothetical protein [Deltaproteobacteria bacterium]